jgi:hypothetical protein
VNSTRFLLAPAARKMQVAFDIFRLVYDVVSTYLLKFYRSHNHGHVLLGDRYAIQTLIINIYIAVCELPRSHLGYHWLPFLIFEMFVCSRHE